MMHCIRLDGRIINLYMPIRSGTCRNYVFLGMRKGLCRRTSQQGETKYIYKVVLSNVQICIRTSLFYRVNIGYSTWRNWLK